MDKEIIIAIISTFGGVLVTALIEEHRTKNKMQKGIMCTLGSDIRRDCNEAIEKGSITLIELRRINENNDVYHELGGNGHVKALVSRVNELPIVDD